MRILFFLAFLFLIRSTASAQFTDDFSDGDFTTNPTWSGDANNFIVNGSGELQLNDINTPVQSPSYLSTASQAVVGAEWNLYMRLDFNPSTSNRARVYLMSDQPDLTQPLNGYFLQVGATGSTDDVSLFRQSGSSTTRIIDGIDGTMATSPEARIRVTRSNSGDWELLLDTALGGTFVSQGTVTDITHVSSDFAGVHCTYTATRSDLFFFDDWTVTGSPILDTVAPVVDSVRVISSTQLDVFFSEEVALATSQNTANYTILPGIGSPSAAVRDGVQTQLVHLTFSGGFQQNVLYQLRTAHVTDNSGNVMDTSLVPFVDFTPQPAQSRDLIINEIFADFTPSFGLPEAEYIEIYNRSTNTVDLAGWTYTDASSTAAALTQYLLLPDSYVVLCSDADVALFEGLGVSNVLGLASWPALNNSGDDLSLSDPNGLLIDQVSYEDDWYRDPVKDDGGWSLELINPLAGCSGSSNWIASTGVLGGTPGQQNSVFDITPDTDSPIVINALAPNASQVLLQFNESLDSLSAATATYQISGGVSVVAAVPQGPDFQDVLLQLNPALVAGTVYDLAIMNVADCEGNTLANASVQIAIGAAPTAYSVVFNELFPDPDASITSLPEAEFIELYNTTNQAIQLDGLLFSDGSTQASFPTYTLLPNAYVIVCEDNVADLWEPFGPVIQLTSWPSLNNAGDALRLTTSSGDLIDAVSYTDEWYQDADKEDGGWTLERINPTDPCAGALVWRASEAAAGGTPGQENSIFDPNWIPENPQLIGARLLSQQTLELAFNRTMDSTSLVSGSYFIRPAVSVDSVEVDPTLQRVLLFLNQPIQPGQLYRVSASGVTDCAGILINIPNGVSVYDPLNRDVVINEILFNPRGSGSDFVELYNRLDHPINLEGWAFTFVDSDGDTIARPLVTGTYELSAEGFVLLNEDNNNIVLEYPNSVVSTFVETDLPTYSNDDGVVTLVDPLGEIIDQFAYDEDMHFGLLRDVNGISLERLDADRITQDRTNWHSAAEVEGFATPGFENSQFSPLAVTSNEITVDPETFSPDNDGFADVVNINYRYDQPGYVANVRIYDSHGREVRDLVSNGLMGREGAYSWDGITDEGEKAAIGIYVIYIEVFTLSGEVEHYKETCVLATRF